MSLISNMITKTNRITKNISKFSFLCILILIGMVFGVFSGNITLSSNYDSELKSIDAASPTSFISIWDTTKTSDGSSDASSIVLPLESSGTYNFEVDWGDSHSDTITNYAAATHVYDSSGVYTISITGVIEGWRFGNSGDRLKIHEIAQWGSLKLGEIGGFFYGCENLIITATDILDLSGVTMLDYLFARCYNITTVPNMGLWDVSNIRYMSGTFLSAYNFTEDIGDWDVSNVQGMTNMFYEAKSFNEDIGDWDVSNVQGMTQMFMGASSFNQNIGGWDLSKCTSLRYMFSGATNFNQDIGRWDVSHVVEMYGLFDGCKYFNQDLGGWDVSNVWDMGALFSGCAAFNQDLSSWDVSSVTNMDYTFGGASSFNCDISSWDVSSVTAMGQMFSGASIFNQDLSGWDVSNVESMCSMFARTDSFNQDISGWDVSNVNTMYYMFHDADGFNQDLSGWDVSSVTDMSGMFSDSDTFDQDISGWDVSSVTDMSYMFYQVGAFDQNIGEWDISSVSNLNSMFSGASLSIRNYHNLLMGWSNLASLQYDLTFWAGNSHYVEDSLASDARDILINTWGWDVWDGGAIVDSNAPNWVQTPEDQQELYQEDFIYNLDATDDVAINQYSINDTANFQIDPISGLLTNKIILVPGEYPLNVSVNDFVGNEISATFTVNIVDITDPVWITPPTNQSIYEGNPLSCDFDAIDNYAMGSYTVNDTENFSIDPISGVLVNYTILEDGMYYLNISVSDMVGNCIWKNISIEVMVDNVNPEWINVPVDQQFPERMPIYYDLDATDNVAVAYFSVNDTTNFSINPASGILVNNTILPLGVYYLNITVVDTVGNNISSVISITILDNTNPEWITFPEDQLLPENGSLYYDLNATDNVAVEFYSVNDTLRFSIDPDSGILINRTILAPGVYPLNISVHDALGNFIYAIINVIISDDTFPEWVNSPTNQTIFLSLPFNYYLEASDNVAIYLFSINDTTHFSLDPKTGILKLSNLAWPGIYHVNISAQDKAGHEIYALISIIIIDDVAPIWVEIPNDLHVYEGDALSYDLNATDNIAVGQYIINDTENFIIDPTSGVLFNNTILNSGSYSLNITVQDLSGNNISIIITITVESIAPSVPEHEEQRGIDGYSPLLIALIGVSMGLILIKRKPKY